MNDYKIGMIVKSVYSNQIGLIIGYSKLFTSNKTGYNIFWTATKHFGDGYADRELRRI